MKIFTKYAIPAAALVGCLTGILNTCTLSDSEKFSRKISQHEAVANSFANQIESATERDDVGEVNRLRGDYEDFEENWREGQSIVSIVTSAIFQPPNKIDTEIRESVAKWAEEFEMHPAWRTAYDPAYIGNAWFVAGRYDKAVDGYRIAQAANPQNSALLLSQARALYYLSEDAIDSEQKVLFFNQAQTTTMEALLATEGGPPAIEWPYDVAFQAFVADLAGLEPPEPESQE